MFRIHSALDLPGFNDVKHISHILIAFLLVEQVNQDLVGNQLVEESCQFGVFETLNKSLFLI